MRTVLLASSVCLLTAGMAAGQTLPPVAPSVPPPMNPLTSAPPPRSATLALPPATAVAQPYPDVYAPVGTAPAIGGYDWSIAGPRVYGSLEYLMWWYTPMNALPLIQTTPGNLARTGAPAGAVTDYFPPGNKFNFNKIDGARINGGVNFGRWGVDLSGFVLERKTKAGALFNAGVPIAIGQGYIAAGDMANTTLYASLPGQYAGGVRVSAESQLWGADVSARHAFFTLIADSTDILTGFRYAELQESLTITSPSIFPDGSTIVVNDSIRTHNSFYGWQFGFNFRVGGDRPGFGMQMTSKSVVGGVHQWVDLVGSNVFTTPGLPPDVQPGGLYARGLNAGQFRRDKGAFLQDLDIRMTYNFTDNVQVYLGYTLIYLSSVMRPGDAIDPVINDNVRFVASPVPSNAARPIFDWRATELVVNGVNFGFRLQY